MEKPTYKAAIITELFSMAENNPDCTMGEILYSFLRPKALNGKSLLLATDEDIYIAQEKVNSSKIKQEEPASQEEFNEWLNNK